MVKILSWNGKHLSTNSNFFNWKSPVQFNGFRLPTEAEWEAESLTWPSQNKHGAYASILKLPWSGRRNIFNDISVGVTATYWSMTPKYSDFSNGWLSIAMNISNSMVIIDGYSRGDGNGVRLIKDGDFTVETYVPETITINDLPYNTIFNETTGKVWLDRNLGATQVAESSTDDLAYGDLYQWGRATDGHEKKDSDTTVILSSTDQPGHGDFILANPEPSLPRDWRDPQNDLLWQGVDGINNPANF